MAQTALSAVDFTKREPRIMNDRVGVGDGILAIEFAVDEFGVPFGDVHPRRTGQAYDPPKPLDR